MESSRSFEWYITRTTGYLRKKKKKKPDEFMSPVNLRRREANSVNYNNYYCSLSIF